VPNGRATGAGRVRHADTRRPPVTRRSGKRPTNPDAHLLTRRARARSDSVAAAARDAGDGGTESGRSPHPDAHRVEVTAGRPWRGCGPPADRTDPPREGFSGDSSQGV